MEFAIRLYFLVVGAIFRRYWLRFLLITILLTLGGGAIAAVSGGAFLLGAKFTMEACALLGAFALFIMGFVSIN